MKTIHQISGYETSRDYERLADEMQKRSVVCIVDYDGDCRDVGHTLYDGHSWQISARGIGYVYAWDREGFVRCCARLNVEAIF